MGRYQSRRQSFERPVFNGHFVLVEPTGLSKPVWYCTADVVEQLALTEE
jgi:hypothetical protein